jgi:hypothetical protein
MSQITKDAVREIVDDFAAAIKEASVMGTKPEKCVINFRNEKVEKTERNIVSIPLALLRFRKENGRIASDVYSYEKEHGPVREDNADDQKILAGFLLEKDPEVTEVLTKSIQQGGQEEPAIITCDGFLINGNRRKLVLGRLFEKTHDARFERMRVVVLPGKGDPGGPPTNREIEQIENRYQFFQDGKSEYSTFDRAISVRRKMAVGMTLAEQLRDDPVHASLSEKDFKKILQKYENDFLHPLACVDRYLEHIGEPGMYKLVSSSIGAKENRWQAFIDYYNYLYKRLEDPAERVKMETLAFNLIRFKDFSRFRTKLHQLIRYLPEYLANPQAKKELLPIALIKSAVGNEQTDTSESPEEIDNHWINANRTEIIRQVNKAKDAVERKDEMDKPIGLLDQSLQKLNHDQMDPSAILVQDLPQAMSLAEMIRDRAEELRKEFYQYQKSTENLLNKHGRAGK